MRLTEEQYTALLKRETKPKAPSKYRNVRTNGHASKGENDRATELRMLEQGKAISNLREQVKYPLCVDGECIGHYVADFVYVENGQEVVEDFKGAKTTLFRWKSKHFTAQYGKDIRLTR